MSTAVVHIPEVGGFPGPARTFAVDPPYEGHSYVTIWAQPGFGHFQRAEVAVVPAVESGAPAEVSLMRRPGSYVLHGEIATPEAFDWACWLALQMLGQPGYDLQAVDAPGE